MSLFVSEIVTPPAHLAGDGSRRRRSTRRMPWSKSLNECILWRAIVRQERRIVLDGPLPQRIEIEPVSSVVSLTRWEPARFPMRKFRGRGGVGSEDTDEVILSRQLQFREPRSGQAASSSPTRHGPNHNDHLDFILRLDALNADGKSLLSQAPAPVTRLTRCPPSIQFLVSRAIPI